METFELQNRKKQVIGTMVKKNDGSARPCKK